LSSKMKNKVISWIDAPKLPTAQEVKNLRQQVMTGAEQPDFARALVQTEKALKNDAPDPLKPLRLYLRRGEQKQNRVIELKMGDFEPFPEQRLSVLKKTFENIEGQLIEIDNCRVKVEVQTSLAEARLKSLYNWHCLEK